MAGFIKFWVDISFISLFKKKYHIALLGIDRLKVNIVLSADGKINLRELISSQDEKPAEVQDDAVFKISQDTDAVLSKKKKVKEKDGKKTRSMPLVVVDLISMDNGRISFVDQSVSPIFLLKLNNKVQTKQ